MDNWKYIKVFVSSTFLDMDIERDALKNIVEPRLNEFLNDYACNIEFIDLRHSVKTTKDVSLLEREKQIFNICLEEIDNCRPYFMGIVGHRYGWIPYEDGVACPSIDLPDGFPVDEEKLSVTMYEFLHGILSPKVPKEHTIIFLRKKDSYIGLTKDQLANYLEKPTHKQYIENVREYIKTNNTQFKVVDYTLPISTCSDENLLKWTELVFTQIKEVIKDELRPLVNEYDSYSILQENYVQKHLRSFCGREKEQKECKYKIEVRGGGIITAQERGLGLTSFFCKIYDNFRKDKMNICLIYCPETELQFSLDDAVTHWLFQLDKIDGDTHRDEISKSKGNQDKVISLWGELIQIAHDKGYKVFLFCETMSSSTYFMRYGLNRVISVTTGYYSDKVFHMRPMMYLIGPYERNTLLNILANQRQEVKDALLMKKSSFCAVWLEIALSVIGKMNKIDFLTIRNRKEDDNETRIIQHQVNLVKELPEDKDEMILFWTKRLKNIFGSELMDNYLFLMSLNTYGWEENILSDILDCDMIQVTTLRQMLGMQIISQTSKGRWSFIDTETEELLSQKLELKNFKQIAQKAYQHIAGVQKFLPIYEQMIFKLAILNGDIQYCSEFIESHLKGDSSIAMCSREGFVWFATHYKYDYLRFVSIISSQPSNPSYQFFYNLLQWSKILSSENLIDEHLATAERIISSLKSLWQEKKIDLKTYSVVCDALACRGDYYRKIKDYRKMFDSIDYGLMFSKDFYKEDDMFLQYYHYCVQIKHEFLLSDRDNDYLWLENKFIRLERRSEFNYTENADTTIYAILLRDTAEIMVKTEHTKDADNYCIKSFRLFIDFLKKQEQKVAETCLSPADTRRNLVVSLFKTIRLYYHYDFLTWEQLSSICEEVLHICDECRLLMNEDISYEYYYRAKAAYYFVQDCDDQKKFTKLMSLADEILKNNDDSHEEWKFKFLTTARTNKYVDAMFESWLYVNSLALFVACDKDDNSLDYDGFQGYGKMKEVIKKENKFVFANHLKLILPFIGAKEFNENNLPPRKIWDSMFILYVSMMFNEANKDMIDLQYLVELQNSANDLSNAIIHDYTTVPMVKLLSGLEIMKRIISEKISDADASKVNLQARFYDFSDCFGIAGDFYSSENGLWINGDPELNERDDEWVPATFYDNIGVTHVSQGDYAKALECYFKALNIRENVLGLEHPETATSYDNIGEVYVCQGDEEKALEYYIKALDIRKNVLGLDHPDTATSYDNIGFCYDNQGDYAKTLEYYSKALAIREKVLGLEHPSTATSYNNIGYVYDNLGDYDKALEYYFKALAIREKVLGPEHPDIATSYNNIGDVYISIGDYYKALEYHSKAMAIRETIYGCNDSITAESYNKIGIVYHNLDSFSKALEFYLKALAINEKVFGLHDIDTAISNNNIGVVYEDKHNYTKALEYYFKALNIYEDIYGEENDNTIDSNNNIGAVYMNLGNFSCAIEYFSRALVARVQLYGEEHEETAKSFNNLGEVYNRTGEYDMALEYYSKAQTIWEKKLGADHPSTIKARENVEFIKEQMNKE